MKLPVLVQVNLPDKEGQMYHATEDNLYLIPTAEVPVTNIYPGRNFVTEDEFPIKCTPLILHVSEGKQVLMEKMLEG